LIYPTVCRIKSRDSVHSQVAMRSMREPVLLPTKLPQLELVIKSAKKRSTPNMRNKWPRGDPSKPVTLRRFCQSGIKGKRRCDRRSAKCSRCLGLGRDCEYINAPLTATFDTRRNSIRKNTQNSRSLTYPIQPPLRSALG